MSAKIWVDVERFAMISSNYSVIHLGALFEPVRVIAGQKTQININQHEAHWISLGNLALIHRFQASPLADYPFFVVPGKLQVLAVHLCQERHVRSEGLVPDFDISRNILYRCSPISSHSFAAFLTRSLILCLSLSPREATLASLWDTSSIVSFKHCSWLSFKL